MAKSSPPYLLLMLAGMAAVTYLPRMLPMTLLAKAKLPPLLLRWLGFVPVAVLAALLAQELFVSQHRLALPPVNWYPVAAIPTLVVAIRTRSLLLTVVVGIAAMALLRYLAG